LSNRLTNGSPESATPRTIAAREPTHEQSARAADRGREQIATPAGLAGSQIADAGVDLQLFMARLNFKFGRDEPAPAK